MTAWRDTTLGELITVKHGYAFKGSFFAKEGKELVLTPGNFPVGGGLHQNLSSRLDSCSWL
jgi:type I restriction enzyme, S subunit